MRWLKQVWALGRRLECGPALLMMKGGCSWLRPLTGRSLPVAKKDPAGCEQAILWGSCTCWLAKDQQATVHVRTAAAAGIVGSLEAGTCAPVPRWKLVVPPKHHLTACAQRRGGSELYCQLAGSWKVKF